MLSNTQDLDSAIRSFTMLRNHAPYRYGGRWYVSLSASGWVAYRTKRAAIRNRVGGLVYDLDFSK